MFFFIKVLLFFISTIGSWEWLRRYTKVESVFLPGLTIAIQTTLLFFSGILNCLPETVLLLYLAGFSGILMRFLQSRNFVFIKNYRDISFGFLSLIVIFFLFFLRNRSFFLSDDFSHWGLVLKQMLQTNRFPRYDDSLILHQNYPMGSSAYIYFFTKLTGRLEWQQMFAQDYMIATCFLPLFRFVKKNKTASTIVIASTSIFMLTCNLPPMCLGVDTLLPLVGISVLLYAWVYAKKDSPKTQTVLIIFYLIQLTQIKNSGIYFVAVIAVWLLYQSKNSIQSSLFRLACISSSPFTLFLWNKHCDYLIPNSNLSRHAMTYENSKSMIAAKTMSDMINISKKLIFFSVTWKDLWLLMLFFAVIYIITLIFFKTERKRFLKIAFFSVAIFGFYQLGLWIMYQCSMPTEQAVELASIVRYDRTIVIYVIYVMTAYILHLLSCANITKAGAIGILLFVIVSFSGHLYLTVNRDYWKKSEPKIWLESTLKENNIPRDAHCCMIAEENCFFIVRYELYSFNANWASVNSAEQMSEITKTNDYLLVYDQNNKWVNQWIKEQCPDQIGNKVVAVPSITEDDTSDVSQSD